jgi:hypothetical protein
MVRETIVDKSIVYTHAQLFSPSLSLTLSLAHSHSHTLYLSSLPLHFLDEAVLVLEEISKQLELKKQKHYSSTSRTISWWVCLFIINITVAILLNSQSVYSFLSAFHLPWVPTVLCGLLAAVSVFSVIENFSTGYMAMSLQANVEEIQTLLKYNESLVRREN